ncbi:hypothetical protein PORCRE_1799 [Porphyromonas crevioricanis JCM 15906]|uniref:Uncharacterized protein n=1 Tax=Porphyromonas crevioricanis JCM 15906 TaxID=1305617 RepID=T1CQF2_9PORP|nr:hypothetical protein [Porphyromonas crevioricanis]GAD06077.1 hypothetical protein PORCRE_1799 [Porphyromonas crevioricanis JCM 15906]SJZ62247.1 hypothetical protein SAMN02745203_00360 [Porphyromonas crevioricanis]
MKRLKHYIDQIDPAVGVTFLFTFIYLLFPSANNTLDSLAYARYMREGSEIFSPHHLLYHVPSHLFGCLIGTDWILEWMCAFNAIGAGLCLWMSARIISRLLSSVEPDIHTDRDLPPSLPRYSVAFALLGLGSCYGFVRFATDAETYIYPLFWALLATDVWLKQRLDSSCFSRWSTLWVALLMAVACLFHQIYFFWYLGLGVSYLLVGTPKERLRTALLYALGGSVVPVVYAFCFCLDSYTEAPNLLIYIFYDYYLHPEVGLFLSPKLFVLSLANLARSFYQLHGYIIPFLKHYPLWTIGVAGALWMLLSALSAYLRCRKIHLQFVARRGRCRGRDCASIFLLIFFLQLGFAALAGANAEFMTMLPFLLFFFSFARRSRWLYALRPLAFSLVLWNFSLALFPSHFYSLQPIRGQAEFVLHHPDAQYYLQEDIWVRNYYLYHFPTAPVPQIHSIDQIAVDFVNAEDMQQDSITGEKSNLRYNMGDAYTDMYSPRLLSRASLLSAPAELSAFADRLSVDTLRFSVGYTLMERISPKGSYPPLP